MVLRISSTINDVNLQRTNYTKLSPGTNSADIGDSETLRGAGVDTEADELHRWNVLEIRPLSPISAISRVTSRSNIAGELRSKYNLVPTSMPSQPSGE
jgi:hypothetical protein